ncbi:SCO family protein [Flagellatimonas centrodinii]|uniref:SCO family protein n=1 Tax=Flagellatimonas centrodinii TaxID=2806210 RepID=UPI001FF7104E|nr:SCO family protein [Flagellatimonas centrodinii]ULQ46435.1 SCO family protein [Flagellatimonas centrodinii]
MQRSFLTALVAIAAVVAGVVVAALLSRPTTGELAHLTVLPAPRTLPSDLTVTDDSGTERPLDSFTGRWQLVFAGFTYCPDICPATLAQLAQVHDALPAISVQLFSVDPERDDPTRLQAYVQHFDPGFGAFTTDEPALARVARALSVAYAKVPTGDSYTVDHSSAVAVLNPRGQLAAFITPPFDVPGIVSDLQTLMGSGPDA